MRCQVLCCLPLLVALAGCGGGGSSSSSPTGGGEVVFGDFVGRAASTNPPIIASSSGTVVTGVTGAFTMLRLRDQVQSIAESQIVYRSNLSYDVMIANGDGSNLRRVAETIGVDEEFPVLSPDGTRIAYYANVGGNYDVYTMKTDGTSVTRITTHAAIDRGPSWSPDGSELVFSSNRNGTYDLFKVNVSTKAVTPLLSWQGNELEPMWSPNGKMVAFMTDWTDPSYDIAVVKSDGTGFVPALAAGTQGRPSWAPDSESLIAVSGNQVARFSVPSTFTGMEPLFGINDAYSNACYSPDGSQIMYGTGAGRVRTIDAQTGFQYWLSPGHQTGIFPSWGNGPKDRTLIGSSSLFGATGAGFLYSTAHKDTQAVLAFGATTQSTVVMTADDGNGSNPPNLVYSIDADTITYISYAQSPGYKVVKVVGAGLGVTSCDGAIVSIDSIDGKIAAVLPFNGTRSTGKPKVSRVGGATVVEGSFIGVYDAEGKNLAPGGAMSVSLNGSTVTVGR